MAPIGNDEGVFGSKESWQKAFSVLKAFIPEHLILFPGFQRWEYGKKDMRINRTDPGTSLDDAVCR